MSKIFWDMTVLAYDNFEYTMRLRLKFIRQHPHLHADEIFNKSLNLISVVCFFDFTKIRICRPFVHPSIERMVYNGHKRMKGFVYQSLRPPNGLRFSVFGPEAKRRNDLNLYYNRAWDTILKHILLIKGRQFCIYEDEAYLLRLCKQ